jgi:GNAT superfamily N-acetyltransferase
MKIEEVSASSADFMRYLARDWARNALALYDLGHAPSRTRCFAASEGGAFEGYLLVWTGRRHPSVILHGSIVAARALLDLGPTNQCTFLAYPPIAAAVEESRRATERHPMDFMVVEAASAHPTGGRRARRLTGTDARALTALYDEGGRGAITDDRPWIESGLAYGIFKGSRLLSVAGTHYFSDDYCLLGGVYTARDHRGRGYATEVTSAVTRGALARVPKVALNVVSTNGPAVHVYQKLGYLRAAEWTWLDVGTGRSPLM